MQEIMTHPLGETQTKALIPVADPISVDTFGGRIHVEWNPQAAVTPLGQLPFFIDYLHASGLFDECVSSCPLQRNLTVVWVTTLRMSAGKQAENS